MLTCLLLGLMKFDAFAGVGVCFSLLPLGRARRGSAGVPRSDDESRLACEILAAIGAGFDFDTVDFFLF